MAKPKIRESKEAALKKSPKIVPDTSIVIEGIISKLVREGELTDPHIILPEFVAEELRAQASRGKEFGFEGLDEIKQWIALEKEGKMKFEKVGRIQTTEEIELAKFGRIDALIVETAKEHKAILYTGDVVQASIAETEQVHVRYFEPYEQQHVLILEKMLPADAMSLHMKENTVPLAKRGKPGKIELTRLREDVMTKEELEEIIREIMDAARYKKDTFIEFGSHSASVVQLGNMRISIARPPFSDGLEVTVVRPILKATLEDYKLADKLKERLAQRAEGILIAGPPGSGKSTFAAALATFYLNQGKIVKTLESPRDLQVPDEITQYAPLDGSFEKTADILLLVRPDYTIFDEVRKTNEFRIFADLRLAGVGMVGVVHATNPVDAIQRFIGRIEMGVIPHVMDTIIFIKDGVVRTVYELSMVVRVPTGMTEADLARPLIEVRDFETGKCVYEIYSYGEENVVIPIGEQGARDNDPVKRLAAKKIREELAYFDRDMEVEIVGSKAVIKVRNDVIPKLIGKEGKTIKRLEEEIGIGIDVVPKVQALGKEAEFTLHDMGANLALTFDKKFNGRNLSIYIDGKFLFTATAGRQGQIRVSKDSDIGQALVTAFAGEREVKAFL